MHREAIFVLFASSCFLLVTAFNIDIRSAKSFKGKKNGEYFGYSVAFHKSGSKFWALVGAPLGDGPKDKFASNKEKYGSVYKCDLSGTDCVKLDSDVKAGSRENKTLQWMGASILSFGTDQDIVACAPRYMSTPWSSAWLQGRCTLFDGKDFTRKSHYWNPTSQQSKGRDRYGYSLAGFSLAKGTKNRPHVITGIPGSRYFAGGLVFLKLSVLGQSDGSRYFQVTSTNRLSDGNYMGYDVAWGDFSGVFYGDMVAGAPKGSKGKGKVLIYQMGGYGKIHQVIENSDTQTATGSYFGAVVCTVNLNSDKKPDILVGAPLFTAKEYEEGKVYVYLSDAKGTVSLVGSMVGETKGARFGSSIVSVGDLNKDGFPDIAVGAPYGGDDGNGAVYIYHGSATGLGNNFQPVQKIYAKDFKPLPSAFGQSISGDYDVDGNQYPDIVVGSFVSDNIHVLKSRPILKLQGQLTLNTTKVSLSTKQGSSCKTINSVGYGCILVEFCMQYSGLQVPSEIDMEVELDLDKGKAGAKRAVMASGASIQSSKKFTVRYQKGTSKCQQEVIYVTKDPKSISTAITVDTNYKYIEPKSGCNGGICPVPEYEQTGATSYNNEKEVTYLRNCGGDDVCNTDLVVDASIALKDGLNEIQYGSIDNFKLNIKVENKKENAFLAKMNVEYADDFALIGVRFKGEQSPLYDEEKKNGVNTVKFDLGNPLPTGKKLDIEVSFGFKKQRPSKKQLTFKATASSISIEDNSSDNSKTVLVKTALLADLTVSGSASPYKVEYDKEPIVQTSQLSNETQVGAKINYEFLVQNLGPAPIQEVSARISLLTEHNGKLLAMLFSATVDGSNLCNVAGKINPFNLTDESKRQRRDLSDAMEKGDKELNEMADFCQNCRNAKCITFDCYIGKLEKGKGKAVVLRTRIFQNTFIKEKRPLTKLTSKIIIILDPKEESYLRQPQGQKPDTNEVSVYVGPIPLNPQGKATPIAWWILLLAILGGLLLISALVLAAYKVGFFKRKRINDITGPTQD